MYGDSAHERGKKARFQIHSDMRIERQRRTNKTGREVPAGLMSRAYARSVRKSAPQRQAPIICSFWHAAGASKASDLRTARKHLAEITSIRQVGYSCCPNTHVCYADPRFSELKE